MTTTDRPRIGPRVQAPRFGITDLMGLILAVACGLGIGRYRSGSLLHVTASEDGTWTFYTPYSSITSSMIVARMGLESVLIVLASITLMLAIRRIPRAWPIPRRLVWEPGFAASVAVSLVVLVRVVQFGALQLAMSGIDYELGMDPFAGESSFLRGSFGSMEGISVLASWVTLWLAGRWRPEATWIDRSGRVVAVIWLAMIPIQTTLEILLRRFQSGMP